MNKANLGRLIALSGMIQDLRLAELSQAEAARANSLAALARLDRPMPDTELDPVAAGYVEVSYARWADMRRVDLKATIARQTEVCLAAQARARTAFGRQQALNSIVDRLAEEKTRL